MGVTMLSVGRERLGPWPCCMLEWVLWGWKQGRYWFFMEKSQHSIVMSTVGHLTLSCSPRGSNLHYSQGWAQTGLRLGWAWAGALTCYLEQTSFTLIAENVSSVWSLSRLKAALYFRQQRTYRWPWATGFHPGMVKCEHTIPHSVPAQPMALLSFLSLSLLPSPSLVPLSFSVPPPPFHVLYKALDLCSMQTSCIKSIMGICVHAPNQS